MLVSLQQVLGRHHQLLGNSFSSLFDAEISIALGKYGVRLAVERSLVQCLTI